MHHAPRLATALLLLTCVTACQENKSPQDKSRGSSPAASGPVRVYIGTYTNAKSKGIYAMELDPKTGTLSGPKLAAATPSPSFLALHPNKGFLYAVNEVDTFDGQKTGSVTAFEIAGADGSLRQLNQQPSGGAGPCHVEVDPAGKTVLVANYGAGSIESVPLNADGSLKSPASQIQHRGSSVDKQRQEGPHAHCITVAPGSAGGDARVLVADLGLDKVLLYRLSADGKLTPNDPASGAAPAGAGPRHIAFGRTGRFVYVNNEMGSSVTAYSYDPGSGAMAQLQTLPTLPDGADKKGNSTAEIAVHPSGKFVYVSNRGHDSIAVFKIDPQSGKLTAAGHQSTSGKTPRSFGIDPTGRFLLAANQNSDTVVVFKIDETSGALTPTGTVASVPSPVCVTFLAR
jgi:6-phosphogluconolactonase